MALTAGHRDMFHHHGFPDTAGQGNSQNLAVTAPELLDHIADFHPGRTGGVKNGGLKLVAQMVIHADAAGRWRM